LVYLERILFGEKMLQNQGRGRLAKVKTVHGAMEKNRIYR